MRVKGNNALHDRLPCTNLTSWPKYSLDGTLPLHHPVLPTLHPLPGPPRSPPPTHCTPTSPMAPHLPCLQNLEDTLREAAADQEQQTQAVLTEYQSQVEAARTAAHQVEEDVAQQQQAYEEACQAAKQAADEEHALRQRLGAAQQEAASLQQSLQGLRVAGRDKVVSFGGPRVVQLLGAIQQSRSQFHQVGSGC